MRGKIKFFVGLALVLAVLVAGGFLVLRNQNKVDPIAVTCIGGSEKSDFIKDENVTKILADRYGITVKWTPMGSYDQVLLSTSDIKNRGANCLWPSSASAQHIFEANHSGEFSDYRAETLLQSPEVIYAGPQGTQALINEGLVTEEGNGYALMDLHSLLVDYALVGKTWSDISATDLRGPINISSTDPVKSNSGFTLAQLELTTLAAEGQRSPSIEEARKALPTMRAIYDAQGLQATSSDNGFRQWLTQGGEWQAPLYAGYENQIIQQLVSRPESADLLSNVRMIYPNPTIYSDHPMLALDSDAAKLIEALKDEELQKIAWQKYGFRSSIDAGLNNLSDFKDLALNDHIATVPATNPEVTLALLNCLQDRYQCS